MVQVNFGSPGISLRSGPHIRCLYWQPIQTLGYYGLIGWRAKNNERSAFT